MGDINQHTATFTTTNMILEGTDSLTSTWGSACANNTGWLLNRPVCLFQHYIALGYGSFYSIADIHKQLPVESLLFLSEGTWTIYYSMCGSFSARYYGNAYTWHHPDISINGGSQVTGYGTWGEQSGTFEVYSTGEPMTLKLSTTVDDALPNEAAAGYVNIYGVRNSGSAGF